MGGSASDRASRGATTPGISGADAGAAAAAAAVAAAAGSLLAASAASNAARSPRSASSASCSRRRPSSSTSSMYAASSSDSTAGRRERPEYADASGAAESALALSCSNRLLRGAAAGASLSLRTTPSGPRSMTEACSEGEARGAGRAADGSERGVVGRVCVRWQHGSVAGRS